MTQQGAVGGIQADPETITGTETSLPRETTSSLTADAVVWPDPSPLDSWWKRVVIDHATALAEGESSIYAEGEPSIYTEGESSTRHG
ncbi:MULTISPECIES: hypothetical protein [Rhodococcus]|uniref:Uncharacterized protein n=1 Tax=Rhodococcus pseudokoreensis TaxID=2811421 RepID=A0A974WBI9_9NOCA|nr:MULTISPECIES: hypothetical protein [Rhodococcus]MBV6756318.1 hypothetical protein [Rhodococcus opacus]QSE94816.1 hypothetical protein JWS13_42535 [Rhodococcus pseudokoreensis]